MKPDFGKEFLLDGKPVRIIAEDASGDQVVVMDTKTNLTRRIDPFKLEFVGVAEFKLVN